jgi:hypothetical protein
VAAMTPDQNLRSGRISRVHNRASYNKIYSVFPIEYNSTFGSSILGGASPGQGATVSSQSSRRPSNGQSYCDFCGHGFWELVKISHGRDCRRRHRWCRGFTCNRDQCIVITPPPPPPPFIVPVFRAPSRPGLVVKKIAFLLN